MADSSGLAGTTRVATATFARILGFFGNDLGADAARLGVTRTVPWPLDFDSARSYRTEPDAGRLPAGIAGA